MLVSGYPDVQSAMAAILEADEIVVKPFEIGRLTELVNQKMLNRKDRSCHPVTAQSRVLFDFLVQIGSIIGPDRRSTDR
jgi:hypothetical protein